MQVNLTELIEVSAFGKSKQVAISNALTSIPKLLSNKYPHLAFLRIEPKQTTILEASYNSKIEKFLYFFLKREITTFYIKMKIEVNLIALDIENIDFTLKH